MFSHATPRSSANAWDAAADGARPTTLPRPCSAVHAARSARIVVVLPAPAGPTSTSTWRPDWQMLSTARRCCALNWTFPVAAARLATLAATVGAVTFSARPNSRASASSTAVEEYFSPCRGRNRLVPSSRWNRAGLSRELRRGQDHGARLRRVDDETDDGLAVLGRREPQVHGLLRRLGHQVPVRPHRPLH